MKSCMRDHIIRYFPQVSSTEIRIYYGCIEATSNVHGNNAPNEHGPWPSKRRVCVAVSADGIKFVKPSLNLYQRNGSDAANNIIGLSGDAKECVLGNVWLESNPAAATDPSARFKLACVALDVNVILTPPCIFH